MRQPQVGDHLHKHMHCPRNIKCKSSVFVIVELRREINVTFYRARCFACNRQDRGFIEHAEESFKPGLFSCTRTID